MLDIECVFPENKRYLWSIINYLQNDAAAKGVKKPKSYFDSFWHQIGHITKDTNKIWIARSQRTHHLVGYMVVNTDLRNPSNVYGDVLRVEYFEVLPRYRRKGAGKTMIDWLKTRAISKQFSFIHVPDTIDETVGFWESMDFIEMIGETGLWWDAV